MFDEIDKNLLLAVPELLKILNFDLNSLYVLPDASTNLDYDFDIVAEEFLRFAEKDLTQGDKHGLVNALSNAKRAIDSQVDKVLGCFGLLSRRNFPQKMVMLSDMGIIAPRIVNKVVKARNYLEHEYQAPVQEQVEDALDIAFLFVTSLDRTLNFFSDSYSLMGTDKDEERTLLISFDTDKPRFILTGYVLDSISKEKKTIGKALVMPKGKGYLDLIRLSVYVEKSNNDESNTEVSRLISLLSVGK
jgi:hypothetical protein